MGSGLSGGERNPPFEQPVAEVKQNAVWKRINFDVTSVLFVVIAAYLL